MKGLLKTRFAAAMLTFSLLAAGAACLRFGATAPQDFPYLSWTGWTIKDFLQQKERPNVVFLGSSLMLVPLDGIDADYLNKRVDGSQHHHSAYFEDKFREKTGLNLRSYTFALPGEMPSDAYLIVKNLLNGQKKPDMIVYGVGPRDFLDNTLPSPAATDPYKFLSRFGSVNPIADRVMPDSFQRLDFELGKLCYFYGQRADLAVKATHAADRTIAAVLPLPANAKEMNADDHHLILPDFRPTEISAGQAWFRPSTPEDRKIFVDNLPEYRQRYKTLNWDTYISQMRFFADTLDEANAKGIKVVVMTMPITDLNRSLLSNLSWKAYRSGVLALAKRKGATIVDYSESKDFSQADFGDTVHLHAVGGRRLFDFMIDNLAKQNSVLSAFKPGFENKQIAERGNRL